MRVRLNIKSLQDYFKEILFFLLLIAVGSPTQAQVRIPFNPRTSSKAPAPYTGVKNYNIQGDFRMIGNTNITLVSYAEGAGNSTDMEYVNVDPDGGTFNSSSSTLVLNSSSCDEILYAGLYWSGRAHDETSSNTFDVTKSIRVGTQGSALSLTNQYVTNGNVISNTNYGMTVTRQGTANNYYPRYTLFNAGIMYHFEVTNDSGSRVRYRIGDSGNWETLPSSYTSLGNTGTATLSTPFVIQDGGVSITITSFRRDSRNNRSESGYAISSYGRIIYNLSGRRNQYQDVTKNLDKTKVKLKKVGGSYTDVTALNGAIYYPTNSDGYMYSAYADVTDYVRQHGAGEYIVGDIALREGNGGGTGFYGGWGMVVIYKNPSMKWRDITVFDGHGYMVRETGSARLPVSGFRAAQNGPVNVTMGMMAGEGDVSIPGDYFQILDKNDNWVSLSHDGNSTNNFFNSSIHTGENPRVPYLNNNTGMDLSMFDLDNTDNRIISNGQTSTEFRYGTSQDTYIIYNIVFAVDAYVPEVIGENRPSPDFGTPPINGQTIVPGQEFEFKLDIYNKGDEAVNNTKIEIPIPSNLHYVSSIPSQGSGSVKIPNNTVAKWVAPVGAPTGATPENTAGGIIVWDIGALPKDDSKSILQGFLKYRLRVSNNCILLATGTCGLEVKINGKISGAGATSGTIVSSDLVRDYGNGTCAGPVYDDFISTIKLSAEFLQGCNPPVEDGVMQFKAFCEVPAGGFPRADVIDKYPFGTKFFSEVPESYTSIEGLVDDDFPVNADGSRKMYYVMVPGMEAGCYAKLEISVDKVTTEPIAQDIAVCFGEEVVLNVNLSQLGQTNGYNLYYFNSAGTQQLSEAPKPTSEGKHTYWVAEGKDGCFGPKKEFTITINALPEITAEVADIEVCTNFNASATVSTTGTGLTYMWEYSTTGGTTWETLENSTFSEKIVLSNGTIEVKYADVQINGTKVRLKISNGQCNATSNVFEIKVKDCPAVTNPMLLNRGIQ